MLRCFHTPTPPRLPTSHGYSLTAAAQIKSTSTDWAGVWDPETHFNTAGPGVFVEGTVKSVRYHSLTTSSDVHRFIAVHVEVKLARKRNYDALGTEVEPRMIGMKRLRTGYLTYQKTAPEDPDAVLPDELLDILGCRTGQALPPPVCSEAAARELHPTVPRVFEFWGDSDMLRSLDLKAGDEVKLRTKSDCWLLHSLAKDAAGGGNYSGGNVIAGWGSKISARQDDDGPLPGDDKEGAADDEW